MTKSRYAKFGIVVPKSLIQPLRDALQRTHVGEYFNAVIDHPNANKAVINTKSEMGDKKMEEYSITMTCSFKTKKDAAEFVAKQAETIHRHLQSFSTLPDDEFQFVLDNAVF